MKDILQSVAIIFFLVFSVIFYSHAEKKELIIGVDAKYPPFVFVKDGDIVGFEVDIVKSISKQLGYDLNFRDMHFKDLFFSLKNKEIDAAIAAISITKERQTLVDFSYSYYFPELSVLSIKQNNINTLKDLQGKTVAALSGTTMEQFLINTLSTGMQIKIVSFGDMDFMLEALNNNKIDAILVEAAIAHAIQTKEEDLSYFVVNYPKYSRLNSYAIAFPKNSDLQNEFNNELLSLKISNQLSALQKKWGITE